MAGTYGATQRQTNTSTTFTSDQDHHLLDEPKHSTFKKRYDSIRPEFNLVFPFNIPSSPEAAAVRIIKNLDHFALYYSHFVWIILLITLIPERKVSLVYFVIMTYVASVYLLILRTFPNSYVLHKIVDKRVVLFLIFVATVVELVLTLAGLHLLFTLVGSVPVVLVHAVLWISEDGHVDELDQEMGTGAGKFVNDESMTVV